MVSCIIVLIVVGWQINVVSLGLTDGVYSTYFWDELLIILLHLVLDRFLWLLVFEEWHLVSLYEFEGRKAFLLNMGDWT